MHLTGLRLTEVRSALNALKERRLPNLDTDLLVARLFTDLTPTFKEYDAIVKTLQRELDAATDDADRKALLHRFEELHDQSFEVPAPKGKLTKDHLPKAFSGERGEANTAANAAIIVALGDEYFAFDPVT